MSWRVRFHDREEAGRALADAIAERREKTPGALADPVVLALPRGGVPVAFAVARSLGAPLDLLMVRKLGVPYQPELAAGAVVDGESPETVYNREVLRGTGLTEADLEPVRERALSEIARRRETYLEGRAQVPLAGRDAIIVDDGIATGSTVEVAIRGVRQANPRSVTLAVPVAPRDSLERLRPMVDHILCLAVPEPFHAVGAHYARFDQVEDEDVVRLLREAAGEHGPSAA